MVKEWWGVDGGEDGGQAVVDVGVSSGSSSQ